MDIGALDKRITIEERTDALDDIGEPIPTWSTVAVCWAGIHDLTGNERIQAAQIDAAATSSIRIRYRAGVSPTMRVRYLDRTWQIVHVANWKHRNERLDLLVVEQPA